MAASRVGMNVKKGTLIWGMYTDDEYEQFIYMGSVPEIAKTFGGTLGALRLQTSRALRSGNRRLLVNKKYYNMYPLWYVNKSNEILREVER